MFKPILVLSKKPLVLVMSLVKDITMTCPYSHLTHEERMLLSRHIIKTYPGVIPVLIKTETKERLKKKKYLLDETETLSRLLNAIRKEDNISGEESLLAYCGNYYLSPAQTFHELYSRYANHDGFLYLTIILEDTFG